MTATTVTFGYTYCSDCDTGNAAIGGGAGGKQDQKSMILAAVADVNAHGGVAGRKLIPLLYDVKSTSSDSIDSQMQSACEYWTKDHKVFAMQGGRQLLWNCARGAGAISLDADGATSRTMHDFPTLLDPIKRSLDQLSAATVAGLERQAWSKPTTEWPTGKIGIITWDQTNYHYAVDHGLVPALKAHGLSATDTRYVVAPETLGAVSDSSAAVSSAVLSFQSKGIDHVLIQDGAAGVFSGAGLTLLFLENAESQHYRPRYGFNVNNAPGLSVYPAAQQHGMLAIDSSDWDARMDAGYRTNTVRERCFAMMRAQGITISGDLPESAAAQYCDRMWFLQQAGGLARTLTVPGVVAAAESMGTRYRPATVFGSRLSPSRHDGDDLIRNARFDDGCSCMKYTSGAYSAG